jgi:hypothetical protein
MLKIFSERSVLNPIKSTLFTSEERYISTHTKLCEQLEYLFKKLISHAENHVHKLLEVHNL